VPAAAARCDAICGGVGYKRTAARSMCRQDAALSARLQCDSLPIQSFFVTGLMKRPNGTRIRRSSVQLLRIVP
jgi:hypothetical protein